MNEEEPFLNTMDSLLTVISIHKDIFINSELSTITYKSKKGEFSFDLEISRGVVKVSKHVFMELVLNYKKDIEIDKLKLGAFSRLANLVNKMLDEQHDKINIYVIQNDVDKYYAELAYPKIYHTENLMRELINKFMLSNLGSKWFDHHVYNNLKVKEKKTSLYRSELHNVDFITLTKDILFKSYRDVNTNQVDNIIRKHLKEKKDISPFLLEEALPRSNWDKYFSKIIKTEKKDLESKWEELYQIRNLVAHNVGLVRREYERLLDIISYLDDKLVKAIKEIQTFVLSEEELESLMDYIKNDLMKNNPMAGLLGLFAYVTLQEDGVDNITKAITSSLILSKKDKKIIEE